MFSPSGPSGPDATSTATGVATAEAQQPCPQRVADQLPGGEGASLVEAYTAGTTQITLCLTAEKRLYYYGEFVDEPGTGLVMPATRTAGGIEATNGAYRYVLHGSTVTITLDGSLLAQETLSPLPSPT
ncbi:hypothetical protein [Streptacidiphilus sp. MAP5-3]|uniref:hypothetical protein n=1 Tax=unclassified Streptacidiphilus TaxID=2643834 RepID=UPI0035130A5E